MAYNYPYGNGQQLNLDWFLNEWKNLLAAWEAEKNGIEGALQAEIDRAEAALADVFAARDAAAQSAANALESKNAAAQSASDASGYLATVRADANTASNAAQNAAQSESNAAESAQTAVASKNAAGQSERNAAQSEANANSSKNAAAQSASDANASKSAAAQSAEDANASKSAAAQSAEDAEDAATSVESSAQQIATNTRDIANLKETIKNNYPKVSIDNVVIASFKDGANNIPVNRFTAETGAKISINGKNLLAKPWTITDQLRPTFQDCFFIRAGRYYMSLDIVNATSWRWGISMFDKNGNYMSDYQYKPTVDNITNIFNWNTAYNCWLFGANGVRKTGMIEFAADCYILFRLLVGDVTSSTIVSNAQLEVGEAQTTYEEYNGYVVDYNAEDITNIKTKYGINNIFSDIGNISLEYNADFQLYVDNKITEIQATMLENIGG